MGTAGNSLIKDIDIQEIISTLDSFYAYEIVVMHFCLAMHNRLEGQATVALSEPLEQKAEESLSHAKELAERIGQLGGVVTGDPSRFVEISPIKRFSLPTSNSDVGEILSYVLEQLRPAIKAYGEFLERIKDKDMVTYYEVLGVLRDHIKSEADIEATLTS